MEDLRLNKDLDLNELGSNEQAPEVEPVEPQPIFPIYEGGTEELIFECGQTRLYLRSSSKSVIQLYNVLIDAVERNLINLNGTKKEPLHSGVG